MTSALPGQASAALETQSPVSRHTCQKVVSLSVYKKLDFVSLQVLYDLKEECQCASGGGLYYLHFDIHII